MNTNFSAQFPLAHAPRAIPRRAALRRLGAGALFAAGLWPGALRAAARGGSGAFRFIVVNDTHVQSPQCAAWLEGVVTRMKQYRAEFCLLAGDLVENGEREHLATARDVFKGLGVPVYTQIGNHDYLTQTDRTAYEKLFPKRLNYFFKHRGWQFVGLDSSDGLRYEDTDIQPATLRWVDDNLRKLDKRQPLVIFTHFPLGAEVKYRPWNADDLLARFKPFNVRAVFSGHFHGYTERSAAGTVFTTNRCCALKRGNHDGTKEKGYFVCTASEGRITREFVECKTPA